jgi:toxin ParE1/3/4
MARVVIAESADEDAAAMVVYLAEMAGYSIAERYNAEFEALYERLADIPGLGSRRPALGEHARVAIVYPFLVIYDWSDDTVTVLRILHGKRRIARELLKR